jgi:transposase
MPKVLTASAAFPKHLHQKYRQRRQNLVIYQKKCGLIKIAGKSAKPITLSDNQRRILEQLANGTHTEQHLCYRAKIIVMAANGSTNDGIEVGLNLSNHTVIKWRNKFHESLEKLNKIEKEAQHKLKAEIKKVLSDEYRIGAPPKFTDIQVATIIALSLEDPQTLGYPFSHWTCELLKFASIERGIVESISRNQIWRFLKRTRFKDTYLQRMAKSKH